MGKGSVKALILAAGYGTRLERDIQADTTGRYKSILGIPKPLIPLAGKALISYWLEQLEDCPRFPDARNNTFIVCNGSNYHLFKRWAQAHGVPLTNIINDGSTCNENRLGACRDIEFALQQPGLIGVEHLIVLGGDTLFFEDFSLNLVLQNYFSKCMAQNAVLWYPCRDEDTPSTAVLETDSQGVVIAMIEKPQPHETKARKACPCFYIYNDHALTLLPEYLRQASEKGRDAPGHFPSWLHKRQPVYGIQVQGRYDIGGLDTYIEADTAFYSRQALSRTRVVSAWLLVVGVWALGALSTMVSK